MTKINRKISVKELKQIEPLVESFEFRRLNFYMIVLNKPRIISSNFAQRQQSAFQIQDKLKSHGIESLVITTDDMGEIRILELKGS